jgi:hypothetical protein
MPTKQTKRSKGQRGGKVAGYKTLDEYEKSPYNQENLNAGRNVLLADMKRSYEPDWKPPADTVEATRAYYRNPKRDTPVKKFYVITQLVSLNIRSEKWQTC